MSRRLVVHPSVTNIYSSLSLFSVVCPYVFMFNRKHYVFCKWKGFITNICYTKEIMACADTMKSNSNNVTMPFATILPELLQRQFFLFMEWNTNSFCKQHLLILACVMCIIIYIGRPGAFSVLVITPDGHH